MTQLPIPVHVGTEPLDHWDDIEARQRQFGEEAAPSLQEQRRPPRSPARPWTGLPSALNPAGWGSTLPTVPQPYSRASTPGRAPTSSIVSDRVRRAGARSRW